MSALAEAADQYLRLRRALGHDLADAGLLLPRYVAYLEGIGAQTLTIAAAMRADRWRRIVTDGDLDAGLTGPQSRRRQAAEGVVQRLMDVLLGQRFGGRLDAVVLLGRDEVVRVDRPVAAVAPCSSRKDTTTCKEMGSFSTAPTGR